MDHHHIVNKNSYIQLKWAQTLDGMIATREKDSKWITNEESRKNVHEQRAFHHSILIGAGTLNDDDPKLTIRLKEEYSIIRLILSKSGKINFDSQVFNDQFKTKTFVITKEDSLLPEGIKRINCPTLKNGMFDLISLKDILYKEHNICSVYVEGGSYTHTEFIKQNAFDKLSIYLAPKLIGDGVSVLKDMNILKMCDALKLNNVSTKHFGEDILIESNLRK